MNKVILYIATSQDGFIADAHGGVDWLPHPKTPEDLEIVGYNLLMERIGIIVMGSTSYKQILSFGDWGWPDKQSYVFSSKPLEAPLQCIKVTQDSPLQLINKMKEHKFSKDIWLLGGAELVKSFAKDRLIDEMIVTIIPKILGKGIFLDINLNDFDLTNEKPLMDNIVQKIYLRKHL